MQTGYAIGLMVKYERKESKMNTVVWFSFFPCQLEKKKKKGVPIYRDNTDYRRNMLSGSNE